MTLAIAKKQAPDSSHKGKRGGARSAQTNSFQKRGSFPVPFIQRKPTCACGGGCPRCKEHTGPTELKIGQPGDRYEQEADRIAERVMQVSDPQRLEEPLVLQRRAAHHAEPARVPPIVQEVLQSPGQPLNAHARAFMEPRFEHDFSQVRVHTDARAAESARAVNALAYTVGKHIVFGEGQSVGHTADGQRLLAHEIAHVVQQERGGPSAPTPQRDSMLEQAADAAESAFIAGRGSIHVGGASAPVLARQLLFAGPGLSAKRQPRSLTGSLNIKDLDDAELEQEIILIEEWLKDNPLTPERVHLLLELGRLKERQKEKRQAAYIERGKRLAPKNADLILPDEAVEILAEPLDRRPFYIPSRNMYAHSEMQIGRILILTPQGRLPARRVRHDYIASVIFWMNGCMYRQSFSNFNQLVNEEVFDIVYVNTKGIIEIYAKINIMAGIVLRHVAPGPLGRLGMILETAGQEGLEELQDIERKRAGFAPVEKKFGDFFPGPPDRWSGGVPRTSTPRAQPTLPPSPKRQTSPAPEQRGQRVGGEETPSRTTEPPREPSVRERVVHEKARQNDSQLKLGDGTHGIAVYGTGKNRDFQFCSPDCSLLRRKVETLVDVLPKNHPSRKDLAHLRDQINGTIKDLKAGRITEDQADMLSKAYTLILQRHAGDPVVRRLLEMSPKEITARFAEIKREIERHSAVSETFQGREPLASAGRTVPKGGEATTALRAQPGRATGGENLPDVRGQWFPEVREAAKGRGIPGTKDIRIAQIPGQIAKKMRGMDFKNFADFRETFWKMVANDPILSKGWSARNLARMRAGRAPFVSPSQAVGGGSNAVYQLNHKQALKNEGDVYNLDNIEVVTPLIHGQIGD